MKKIHTAQKGFTLIELLMVIAIIGLLSSIVMGNINSSREKARITAGIEFSTSLKRSMLTVLEFNFDDSNNLNEDANGKIGSISGTISESSDTYNDSGFSGDFTEGAYIDYLSKSDNQFDFNNESFAISLWMKANSDFISDNSYSAARLIYTGHCGLAAKGYSIAIDAVNGGRIYTGVVGESRNGFWFGTTDNLNILDDKWHNIVTIFNFDTNISNVYVDGNKVYGVALGMAGASCATSNNGNLDFSACNLDYFPQNDSKDLRIGRDAGCGTQTFEGLLDDVIILKEA